MKYQCLKKDIYSYEKYQLVTIRLQDMFLIKKWRNEQMSVLRQNELLTEERQIQYFNSVIVPSTEAHRPRLILFSFIFDGSCIGYGGLTNVDWKSKRAEVSFLLDTERIGCAQQYQIDFQAFLHILKEISFEDIGLNRLFTETYDIRPSHVEILENSGFQLEGRLKEHIFEEDRYIDSLMHGCLKAYYNAGKNRNSL